MKYYLRVRGKVFGPFDAQQLLDLKDKGKLSQASELSPNKVEWSPAESFGFLFPPSAVSPKSVSTYAPPAEAATSSTTVTAVPAPITPLPPSGGPAEWYYSSDGASGYGPVEAGEVVRQIQSEVLNADSLVWRDGQSARPIHAVSAFAQYVTPQNSYAQPIQQRSVQQRSAMPQYAMPRREFTEQATAVSQSLFGWLFDFEFSNLRLQIANLLQTQIAELWLCRIVYAINFIVTILFCARLTWFAISEWDAYSLAISAIVSIVFGLGEVGRDTFIGELSSFLSLPFIYCVALLSIVSMRVSLEFGMLWLDQIVATRKAAKMYTANEQAKFD